MEPLRITNSIDAETIVDEPAEPILDWRSDKKAAPLAPETFFAVAPPSGLDRPSESLSNRTGVPTTPGPTAEKPSLIQQERIVVLVGDVAGYSRLIELDTLNTVLRIRTLRRHLIQPSATAYQAHIVRLAGDGILMMFSDPHEAVACAVSIQRSLFFEELHEPTPLRLRLRIGLALGDIILDGDDFHGHGINVATRLEALAEPGGILMSGSVYNAARPRLSIRSEALGRLALKNLVDPVPVYRIHAGDLQV